MSTAISPFRVSSCRDKRAVVRFGEKKFWSKTLSTSIIPSIPPFSSNKRPPQTPQKLLQNQTRFNAELDMRTNQCLPRKIAAKLEPRPAFQLIFISEDKSEDVEVKEVDEIDFSEVSMRVAKGDSVFITRRETEKIDASSFKSKTKRRRGNTLAHA